MVADARAGCPAFAIAGVRGTVTLTLGSAPDDRVLRPRARDFRINQKQNHRSCLNRAGSGLRPVTRSSAIAAKTFDASVCLRGSSAWPRSGGGTPRLLRRPLSAYALRDKPMHSTRSARAIIAPAHRLRLMPASKTHAPSQHCARAMWRKADKACATQRREKHSDLLSAEVLLPLNSYLTPRPDYAARRSAQRRASQHGRDLV